MSIKFLAEDDRPREKFLHKGKNALSDAELLAIILSSGNREESAVELARKMLKSVDNNWHQLSLLSINDLMKFRGVGEAKAISIAAALEIGRRKAGQDLPEKTTIKKSEEAYRILAPFLSDLQTEEFWAIFLNQKNNIVHKCKISQGGISGSTVDARILFKLALENFATGIILAHNHPTGDVQPSQTDLKMTRELTNAAQMLDMKILDHLIISQNHYFSFADEQLL